MSEETINFLKEVELYNKELGYTELLSYAIEIAHDIYNVMKNKNTYLIIEELEEELENY